MGIICCPPPFSAVVVSSVIGAYTDSDWVSVISTEVSGVEPLEFIAMAAPPPTASVAARTAAVIFAPRVIEAAEAAVDVAAPVAAVVAAVVAEAVVAVTVADAAVVVAAVAAKVAVAAEDTASPIKVAFVADMVAGSPKNIVIRGSREMP